MFKNKEQVKLGLYGPPNAGKSTLANKICQDWLGEDMSTVSNIPHETREIIIKEQINIKSQDGKKELAFNLVDTPGIATRVDYEDFLKSGMKSKEAKKRAKEATKGVVDSIKWLDEMDPKIIIIGEAPSGNLNYYQGYDTITQNSAGDIIFECTEGKVHIYVSSDTYSVDFLDNENKADTYGYYIGTLNL